MFKLNHRGQSLPIVLGVTALILANTYYALSVDKTSTARTQLASAQVMEQTERSRISSFLADYNVCASQDKARGNFYNIAISTLTNSSGIAFPLVKPHPITAVDQAFLAVNSVYANNTHRVRKYFFGIDTSIASTELKYFLQVEYDIVFIQAGVSQINTKAPKTTAVIRIPLFVQLDGANNVINCYARPAEEDLIGENSIAAAVDASCKLTTPSANNSASAYLNISTSVTRCFHTLTPTTCPSGQVMNGTTTNPNPQNNQQFTCTGLDSLCATTPVQQAAIAVSTSVATCNTPDNGGCAAGTFMIKSGSTVVCSQNCPTTQLFHSISITGVPVCYERTSQCPAGEFAKSIQSDGTPDCDPIKYKSVDCGALKFATDLDPAYAGADPLKCGSYTRTKDCPGTFNYVSSFQSPTVACRNLNY